MTDSGAGDWKASNAGDWKAWLRGVLVAAAGGGVAAFVGRRVSEPLGWAVGQALGDVAAEVAIGALVLGGMTLGVAPGLWLIGRGRVARARSMLLALPLSGAGAGAAGLGTWSATGGVASAEAAATAGVVAGLTAFAVCQWAFARRWTRRPVRWAATNLASLVTAFAATILLAFALGDAASGHGQGGAAFGAGYVAVAGWALLRAEWSGGKGG